MTARKALVIGGGIGGPVAAMALHRAGIQATVHEAASAPADYAGLFLNTSSNGLDVLRTLDIDVAGQADGFPMPRRVMWSGTGKRLGEVANGVQLPDGTVSMAVKRGLLQRVLDLEAERRGVKFEFGKRLVDYRVTGDGEVVARFADGTQAEGDLLLGADGIHSATRPGHGSSRSPALLHRAALHRRLQPQLQDSTHDRHPALRLRQAGVLRLPGARQRRHLVVH
jgi:FAD-dependent urate hydroxylase